MHPFYKNLVVWFMISLIFAMLFRVSKHPNTSNALVSGGEIAQHRDYSELTARRIDEEVRKIITGAYKKTLQLLTENTDTLHRMADALLEKETLGSDDIDAIMGDRRPRQDN